jgi:hypothetical protein
MTNVLKRWIARAFVVTLFAACGGDTKPQAPTAARPAPKAPLVEKTQVADWCPEHGVPESICTRCNAGLIDSFKKKGDWCLKHELPDSQCFVCHPEIEAKFKAIAPKKK